MSLPQYRKPHARINVRGAAFKRKWPTRQQSYVIVTRRAKGKCELCSRAQDPLDPHHAFGRGHIHGIPSAICDSPELIVGVCRTCHDRITGLPGIGIDQELADKAQFLAIRRFCEAHDELASEAVLLAEDMVDEMRRLVRVLDGKE